MAPTPTLEIIDSPDIAPPLPCKGLEEAGGIDGIDNTDPRASDSTLSIIVLGASGDLAKKKTFPALFNLYRHVIFLYKQNVISSDCLRNIDDCSSFLSLIAILLLCSTGIFTS